MDYLLFRYRRAVRRLRRRLLLWQRQVTRYVNRHIWGKWYQLRIVKRFLVFWTALFAIAAVGLTFQILSLEHKGRIATAIAGGTYSEAALGTVQVVNPLLPDAASADVDRLIFSGLTRYDEAGHLTGDLAKNWDISTDGKTYTFHLRPGVKWHDGIPFTSADVAFTIAAIQNPDSRSPLASSWQGVKVETKGDATVVFTIPSPLASFLDSVTIGMVPRHVLESIEPSLLREADFNQKPIGTGPFMMKTFAPAAQEITLVANPRYHLGRPRLGEFTFRYYPTPDDALAAYDRRQVLSPGRIGAAQAERVKREQDLTLYEANLPEETTLFFQTTDPVVGDAALRRILSRSLDREALITQAQGGEGRVVTQPLLPGQTGYTNKYALEALSPLEAGKALDELGYIREGSGTRRKGGTKLALKLVTIAGGPLQTAAEGIKKQYEALGIDVKITAVALDELQQTFMRPRNFQLLLFGVNVGADPDVYAYWHSTQASDPGVNLSKYASPEADKALEAGRINTNVQVRTGKYDTFLKTWNNDAPAAVLYQTAYRYAVDKKVRGVVVQRLITPGDRFADVVHWTVRQTFVPRYR